MTAPIPARSRVLREAPVWINKPNGKQELMSGRINLGFVRGYADQWFGNACGCYIECVYPTREAAMAAVEAAVLEIPEDKT